MGLTIDGLRRMFDMSTRSESEAAELQRATEDSGSLPIQQCDRGTSVRACGVLRSVISRPRAGTATLEAELYDGSGSLTLVWLGRRNIKGIEAGKSIVVKGRLTCDGDDKTLFNPRYELRPNGVT